MEKRDIFEAIADPTRRAILLLVATQAMTPNAIAAHFDSSRQAVSKHLQVLTTSELLRPLREGREVYYHLEPARLKEVDLWLEQFRSLWEDRFSQLDDVLRQLKRKKK